MTSQTVRPGWRRWTVRLILVAVVLLVLVPIGYLVSLSVRPPGDVLNSSLLPDEWTTANFTSVFDTIALGAMLQNSWISAAGAAILAVVIATPAAYFTARHVRGERLLTVLLASYCAPPIVAIIPLFFLLRDVGLTNHVAGLVVVNGIANVPVAAWLIDGFVRRIPVEIDEAAVVDGLSTAGAFRKAILPLLWPGVVAALLVVFFLSYNGFLFAVYLAVTKESQTLTVGLSLFQGDRNVQFGQQAAAGLLGIAPVYVLALLAQRHLVGGLATGATK